MRVFVSVLAAVLTLPACAPVPPPSPAAAVSGVVLTAEPAGAGTVRLILDNGARDPIGYNLCASTLQRHDGLRWSPIRTDEVCTMELRILEPGRSATFDKTIPAGLSPGEYRYVTSVEDPLGGAQRTLASGSFGVQ
jgi:hypothetical protein